MDEDNTDDKLRLLRQVRSIKAVDIFSVIDEIEAAQHLLRASIMASESIEAMDERNALVALLAEIERRLAACTTSLRATYTP